MADRSVRYFVSPQRLDNREDSTPERLFRVLNMFVRSSTGHDFFMRSIEDALTTDPVAVREVGEGKPASFYRVTIERLNKDGTPVDE